MAKIMEEFVMIKRGRRLRVNAAIRDMVRETSLNSKDFIYPIFVVEGDNIKNEISSLPGVYHYSVDRLYEVVEEVREANISGVLLLEFQTIKMSVVLKVIMIMELFNRQ